MGKNSGCGALIEGSMVNLTQIWVLWKILERRGKKNMAWEVKWVNTCVLQCTLWIVGCGMSWKTKLWTLFDLVVDCMVERCFGRKRNALVAQTKQAKMSENDVFSPFLTKN